MSDFTASHYQTDIFKHIKKSKKSLVINALAGSGKTTTIVKSLEKIPRTKDTLFCAFNKHIAVELQKRVPSFVKVQTLNGLGHGAWCKTADGKVMLNPHKNRDILKRKEIREIVSDGALFKLNKNIIQLIRLGKVFGIVPDDVADEYGADGIVDDTDKNWLDIIDHFDMNFDGTPEQRYDEKMIAIKVSRTCLGISLDMWNEIDFDDQIYMPVVYGSRCKKYDVVFVDEAQDISNIQLYLLRSCVKRLGGKLVSVADRFQAIYGFRGSDVKSVDRIKKKFKAEELPLSICYRCAKNIVREAQTIVPQIEYHEDAIDGQVINAGTITPEIIKTIEPDAMILCRNTAPLVQLAFQFLKSDKPCYVLGRDIGKGTINLLKKMKTEDVVELRIRLKDWFKDEVTVARETENEGLIERLEDRYLTATLLIEKSGSTTTTGVIRCVEQLFGDRSHNGTMFCTIHKAKGLEAKTVYFLDQWLIPSRHAVKDWQKQQENNIKYVGITRAMEKLVYIDSGMKKPRYM